MKINFNEEKHEYTLGEKVLVSTTTLLRLAGISPDYSAINESLLKKSASRGTYIHQEMENYIKSNEEGFTPYPKLFQKWLNENDYVVAASELVVYDDNFAGTIDLIVMNSKTHEYYVYDFKTTSTIHRNSVSWQASIYAFLWEKMTGNRVSGVGAIHLRDDEFKPINLMMKSSEKVSELLVWYLDGMEGSFIKEPISPELEALEEIQLRIAYYEKQIKLLEEEKKGLFQILDKELQEDGVSSLENDMIVFTRVEPFERTTFDSSAFKNDNPDLYKKYAVKKMTEVGYRVKIKKGKEND